MNRTFYGDCRETLRTLQPASFQCCVTSPPYYGLRDYGHPGQVGIESSPTGYVTNMVDVFCEVRRVLADDGVLWLNLGDTYASSTKGSGGSNPETSPKQAWKGSPNGQGFKVRKFDLSEDNLKPKDLIGIPWRVAFALQADGWYLRQDIIWHKPNPMPESVRDRCTKAHEYLFLLTKSERYFWDAAAMQEKAAGTNHGNRPPGNSKRAEVAPGQTVGSHRPDREESTYDVFTRNRRSVWTVATRPYSGAHFAVFPPALIEPCILAGSRVGDVVLDPFMGSGTTAQVAQQHGRQWIGCELNDAYAPLQSERLSKVAAPVFDISDIA